MSALYDGNLRGSRLGTVSYENDGNVDFAARQAVRFNCPQGHVFALPFSIEAEELPTTWECRCGAEALRQDASWPDKSGAKVGRTHWDMLMERRTIEDLEELFLERLALLREARGASVPISVTHAVLDRRPQVNTGPSATAESRSA